MRVMIRRDEPLFTMRRHVGAGPLRRALAAALLLPAAAAAAVCVWLWAAQLGAAPGPPLDGLAARWHVWMATAVVAGTGGFAALRNTQRPT